MIGRDLAEEIGIVDHGPEKIDAVDHRLASGQGHQRSVVGLAESDQYIRAWKGFQPVERAPQRGRPDLRSAAAAAHGERGNVLPRLRVSKAGGQG